ncbi:capping protein-inhibiting regulator of actin dynamics [Mantella aurantiaca]
MADEREAKQDAQEELLSAKVSEKKRTGKFQPLRKLFGKKKKKSSSILLKEGKLKPSRSIGSVCSNPASVLSSDEEAYDDLRFLVSSMGTRAFSHDSIFIPDEQAEDDKEAQVSSQDCVVGKVKSLQQQLGKNIRFGQPPPTNTPVKKMQDLGAGIEKMEETYLSPMEASGECDTGLITEGNRARSLSSHGPRNASEIEHKPEEKVTPVKTSRPKRPSGTIESINLDAVPRSVARLDNSAAKHKLSVKPKNQRVSKKHRGMSQEFNTIEDNENEFSLNMQRTLDKAMFHSMDIPSHDILLSDHFERKIRETQVTEQLRTLVSKGENKINKDQEDKQPDPSTSRQVVQETRQPDEEKSEADKRKEEEERKRQEIIRKIDLERLQQKIKEQNENEQKEQRRREEERKQRAEQILKELEEHRRQEEQKQREQEQKNTLRLAEEQKKRELEIQKALQMVEEQRKQEMEKQRAIQLAEEQKRHELEQRAIQIVEEQRKYEQEKQKVHQIGEQKIKQIEEKKAPQIAVEQKKCDIEEWEAMKNAEEQKQQKLDVLKALQVAEEPKKCELQQQKDPEIAEKQRQHQLELKRTLQIMEEQKKQELELQKAEEQQKHRTNLEQQKNVQIDDQKGQEMLEHKAPQIVEEQQLQKSKSQSQQESEDFKVQHSIKEEMSTDSLNRIDCHKKPNFEEQHISLKKEQVTEDIKGLIPEHTSPLYTQAVSAEKDLSEQKMEVEVKGDEEEIKQKKQKELESQEQERINEELRWQELDQKQRPFTFKVTSGEKQIIFEKVNLSPVTVPKEPGIFPGTQDTKENKGTISSHSLPSAQCIPHTAILVTGAQLCGTAVNLHQIKDPACKSLLGLNEERKLDIAESKIQKEKDNTKHVSSKTKYTSEALDNQSFLAEWASIRSKILNKAENVDEKNQGDLPVSGDDSMAKAKGDSHSSLRKTMSAIPKFSITPAWQKFPETGKLEMSIETSVKSSSKENIAVLPDSTPQGITGERTVIAQEMVTRIKKQVTIDGNAEGWIFSKDLPSFLVPNPPPSPRRGFLEGQMSLETQLSNGTGKTDKLFQNTEDKISPFGIKLRRTNYSLRFHADPQNEQRRKKRYSAGDSFEGVPSPLTPTDETEIRTIAKKELLGSPMKMKKDNLNKDLEDTSSSATDNAQFIVPSFMSGPSPHVSSLNKDKVVPKSPVIQKPSLAPKPPSPTPPSSPLSHLGRTNVTDLHGQRLEKDEKDKETVGEVNSSLSSPNYDEVIQQDANDRAGLPSISWREKTDKRLEKIGKDRPVLQSRHSLDGSRLMEKVEPAQPQWITLALQKQKGFRDQQASRDERRQAREAKQADKLAKENPSTIPTAEYRGRSGSLQKPLPHEEKKSDTVVTRLQRREQLQKSNTLPTSVTVEITETVPVALAKDLPKRFSTPDASPVSSEPAWLALAKRKSKAWSDCPQIIK